MTHFEFITVAVSMIYALSIARCLDAIPSSFDPSRRYWVHFVWLCVKLVNPIILWWSMWSLNGEETFSFATFFVLLLIAILLYLQVIALVTTDPRAISDWRSHYYSKRKLFFGANALLLFLVLLTGHLLFDPPSPFSVKFVQFSSIVLSVFAMLSERPKLHAGIAALAAINMFGGAFGLAMAGSG